MKPSNDREAVTLILTGMQDAGWTITKVNDGEEVYPVNNAVDKAVGHVMDVDMAHVFLVSSEGVKGWVWFVLGNDPEEVAADYTLTLDPDLSAITDPWWN
jgi:hypothetical protein